MARERFHSGSFYHIYNRGNNGANLFREPPNYHYFLRLYRKYLYPFVATYAYCLLPNHFHFLIRTKDLHELQSGLRPDFGKQFANCFGTYAKAVNARYGRTGSLFEGRIKRKRVSSERYFVTLAVYIHRNPQAHGLIGDFREWKHSSYRTLLSEQRTLLQRDTVLAWFGGRQAFVKGHERATDPAELGELAFEELVP